MNKILKSDFFKSKDTVAVARGLLGKFLAIKNKGEIKSYMIREVEAYDGFKDAASHAHCGKTKRNKIMFGKAGHWYVYFTYGMHFMLNIVTGSLGYPAAILIRGIEGVNGPAKLTKKLKIDKKLNGLPAVKKSGLWLEDRGIKIKSKDIKTSPRIGVEYAGPIWSKKKFRFFL